MSVDTLKNELKRAMIGAHVKLSDDMLSKCLSLAQEHNIPVDTFVLTWEAYSCNAGVESLNANTFSSFRNALLKEVAPPETVTPTPKSVVVSRPSMAKRSVANMETPSPNNKKLKDGQLEHIISNAQSSPLKNNSSPETVVSSSSALVTPNVKNAYENRKNSGQVIASYNPANLPPLEPNGVRTSVIEVMEPSLTKPYKHMTDKPVHHALNSRLEDMSQKLINQYFKANDHDKDDDNMDMEDIFEQVGVPRQSVQFNVGRICNESHSGKINATTILLEGSRSGSNGARISVDVSRLENYSLYPGQIVGVKGMNLSGRKIMAEEIIEGIETNNDDQMAKTKRSILKETNKTARGTKIFTVAGPYTTEDLEYKPLENLLEKVVMEKPDVVIMMGPFVDMRMEKIANGEMTVEFVDENGNPKEKVVSYEAFFAAKISNVLEDLFEEMKDSIKTQFVLVPSTDDAIAEPVFPQPPLQDTFAKVIDQFPETELFPVGSLCLDRIETAGGTIQPRHAVDRRVHLVANPSTIRVNEVTIGITSNDSFFQLSCEETNAKLPIGSRLSRLAQHFIRQQSYYPIFPVPVVGGCDLNLDVTQQDAYALPVQPDILLLPSRLTALAMDVANGTTVVNPGHLIKGAVPGSYAVMDIHPMKDEVLEGGADEDEISHGVRERIRVEVRRI